MPVIGTLSDLDAIVEHETVDRVIVAFSRARHNDFLRIVRACADSGVKVNAACPGWCRTDMGGPNAPRTADEGVDTAAWLASLPPDGPTGCFFRDRQPIPW